MREEDILTSINSCQTCNNQLRVDGLLRGRAYLIELKSDIELSRGGETKVNLLICRGCFHLINFLIRINWGKKGGST